MLLGKMAEQNITQAELAKSIGMAVSTLSSKLKGRTDFKMQEAKKICNVLNIDDSSLLSFFY